MSKNTGGNPKNKSKNKNKIPGDLCNSKMSSQECRSAKDRFSDQTVRLSKKAQRTIASMVAVGVIGVGGLNFYASTNHYGQDQNERVMQKLELTESELSRQLEVL